MTFLEKIKPHLLSDDFLIQKTVLQALHEYPNVPKEWTVELLKEAFRNQEKLTSILIYIDSQTVNEEALDILIENIPNMDMSTVHLALGLLDNIEPALALRHRTQLEKYINEEKWALYELMVNGTEAQVNSEYVNTLKLMESTTSYNYILFKKAKNLAKCLVQNNWITEEKIDTVIEKNLNDDWFSYDGILAVYMIGLLQVEKYIPILASLLERDEDILLEETAPALIAFQTETVIKEVEPYLLNPNSAIFATSVIENIKSDLAIQVLRKAYRNTNDGDYEDLIIEALCHQLSNVALPEISDHMKKEFFSDIIDMEQVAYGCLSILGESHPDLQEWREVAMEKEMRMRNFDQKENLSQHVSANQTPKRIEEKIGRNDPCPCGSGKKYKKCCGK